MPLGEGNFNQVVKEDRWFDGWIRVLMGRAFSPHIPPHQVRLGSVSDNHYTHQWTINHQFLLLVICQWGENDGRPTEHIMWTSSGIGQILTPLVQDGKWKVCVQDGKNVFMITWMHLYGSFLAIYQIPYNFHHHLVDTVKWQNSRWKINIYAEFFCEISKTGTHQTCLSPPNYIKFNFEFLINFSN